MMRSLLAGVCALSLATAAFAQQTVVGGPGAPPATSGGGGTPGGSSGQVQYNNGGSFGGVSTLTNASGVITNSASATGATLQLTGTETASTSSAMLYVDPSATATSTFNSNGTLVGVNAASGFTGNLIDLQINGASKFSVNFTGGVTIANTVSITGLFNVNNNYERNGRLIFSASPTTIGTGGSGSTNPTITGLTSSAAFSFAATSGSTATTFAITFPTAASVGWACNLNDQTTATTYLRQTANTTTTATFQAYTVGTTTAIGLASGDVITAICMPY